MYTFKSINVRSSVHNTKDLISFDKITYKIVKTQDSTRISDDLVDSNSCNTNLDCDFLRYEILVNNICKSYCVHYHERAQSLRKMQYCQLLLISCPNQNKIYAILCLHCSRFRGKYQNLLQKTFVELHARLHLYSFVRCIEKYIYSVQYYFLTYSQSFHDIKTNTINSFN